MEGNYETRNVLDFLKKGWVGTLKQVRIMLEYIRKLELQVLTLKQEITCLRFGAHIGTAPIMLNTSIQNNGHNPSKNSFKLPNTR